MIECKKSTEMKHIIYSVLILLLAVACKPGTATQPSSASSPLQPVKSFQLSKYSTLQLYRSSDTDNYVVIALLDDERKVNEVMGIGNSDFCTSPSGDILLDTVTFTSGLPACILRTYDISSTYGAETWYILSPYYDFDPDSFWRIDRIPFDILSVRDINNDGLAEIISYPDPQRSDSTVYSFHQGLLSVCQ